MDPVTSYNRVPPPFDPNSRDSHLDGEFTKLEQSTASIIAKLGGLDGSLATAVADLEAADTAITAAYIAADVVVTDAFTAADAAEAVARDAAIAAAIGALSTTITEFHGGIIAVPTNKDYTVILKAPTALTILETTTKSLSGTCTATFKINATALGGTANSVSSTEDSQTHSTGNAVAAGDDVIITVSSNATCLDLAFTIKTTRTVS